MLWTCRAGAVLLTCFLLAGCDASDPQGPLFAEELGGPIPGLDEETLASFDRGRAVMEKRFQPSEGLGPGYNASSCTSCHFFPVTGGASDRHRDVFLLQGVSSDGTRVDYGTEDGGPLRKLYSIDEGHVAPPSGATVHVRRAALAGLGVGLFGLVSDEEILSRADPDDANGDGISGRASSVGDEIGRFGYKAQSSSVEDLVRGALRDQMGITSPGVDFVPAELALQSPLERVSQFLVPTARAHPSNSGEDPASDSDGVADPELSGADLRDLLTFVTYLAPPPPVVEAGSEAGRAIFEEIGCAHCHVPTLDSPLGPIPAWTDLLLHDMGDQAGDDIAVGDAGEHEFRTTPLWAVRLNIPYIHDGSAPAYQFTMYAHGGEAAASARAYEQLSPEDQSSVARFLDSLGGWNPKGRFLVPPGTSIPAVGEPGSPDRALTLWEEGLWISGRSKFDRAVAPAYNSGLGEYFNADSCRACHTDPALGGAGGRDLNVLLFGGGPGVELPNPELGPHLMPRSVITQHTPWRMPDGAVLVEQRQAPTLFGLGLLEEVPFEEVFSRHDPDDLDGDGISGRARILTSGELGRFGWKAQVPDLLDFTVDAMAHEIGITTQPRFSDYAVTSDGDIWDDPEVGDQTPLEIAFYMRHIGPPARKNASDPLVTEGEELFVELGCADCHVPDLGGVPAYTDLLLHDIAPDGTILANTDPAVLPGEFRTPPLWGIGDTAPYLHDGSAETLQEAILAGHAREGEASSAAFAAVESSRQAALLAFLESL